MSQSRTPEGSTKVVFNRFLPNLLPQFTSPQEAEALQALRAQEKHGSSKAVANTAEAFKGKVVVVNRFLPNLHPQFTSPQEAKALQALRAQEKHGSSKAVANTAEAPKGKVDKPTSEEIEELHSEGAKYNHSNRL